MRQKYLINHYVKAEGSIRSANEKTAGSEFSKGSS